MSAASSSSSSSSSEKSAQNNLKRKHHVAQEQDSENTSSDSESSQDSDDSENSEDEQEIQVLSHAAQRKEKKRQKLSEKASQSKAGIAKSGKDGTTDVKALPKRQNSIWVGNLSFKTTPNTLKAFFDGVGEITRVHIPTKVVHGSDRMNSARSENKGFAYVDFATAGAKTIAITMSEKNLEGRRLLIKDGDDFAGRPVPMAGTPNTVNGPGTGLSKTAQKILRDQKQPAAPTLFLGNLGFETTEKSIRELFEAHKTHPKKKFEVDKGTKIEDQDQDTQDDPVKEKTKQNDKGVGIRKIRLGTFEDSGACKGFAFVDFMTVEDATAALINPRNHRLDGRTLVVEYASADAVRRGGGPGPRMRMKAGGDAHKLRHSTSEGSNVQRTGEPRVQAGEEADPKAVGKSSESFTGNSHGDSAKGGTSFRGGGRGKASRPRPGAALALARRENVAIVPSQGKRLTFT